jgi:cobalt-zinc-cadmium efflux system protein
MGHGHHHHHHTSDLKSERRLWLAIVANGLLTLFQIVGGLVSGSLSLIADALHNFSDAASLGIAVIAIRIGRRPADEYKTFGYKRAETIAALINLTTLLLIGLYLVFEAVKRFYSPETIDGGMVIIVAGIALLVDLLTVALTYKGAKDSLNLRAALLHNVTDAMASVGVILAGVLIMLYGWMWVDAALTLAIAVFVVFHGIAEMPKVIHILMDGAPEDISINDVAAAMEEHEGVENVHHIHIWRMDEKRNAIEAHVRLCSGGAIDDVKIALKKILSERFAIEHSTLEFEEAHCADHGPK